GVRHYRSANRDAGEPARAGAPGARYSRTSRLRRARNPRRSTRSPAFFDAASRRIAGFQAVGRFVAIPGSRRVPREHDHRAFGGIVGMSTAEQLDALLSEDIANVREREALTFDHILKESGGRCVLFGAGSLGWTVLRCLRADGVEPLAFTDNNPARW